MLREGNGRGSFEREEFETVSATRPNPLCDVAGFAYLRKGQIVGMTWDQVTGVRRGAPVRLERTQRYRRESGEAGQERTI